MHDASIFLVFRDGTLIDTYSKWELKVIWVNEEGAQGHTYTDTDTGKLIDILAEALTLGG
jgi:hypothetical protein